MVTYGFLYWGVYHTSANTLEIILILLACHPRIQKTLQAELDEIFGEWTVSTWSHTSDFPKLLNGYTGVVLNETLRLYGVLPFIPRATENIPLQLPLKSGTYTVPANCLVLISTNAVHRHPKHWPHETEASASETADTNLDFRPERWLDRHGQHQASHYDSNNGAKLGPGILNRQPGTYIPFSVGPRSCIGKRFAQVEICAVLAAVMKDYTVELVDDDVDSMTDRTRKGAAWERKRQCTLTELSAGMGFKLALELTTRFEVVFVKRHARMDYS